MKENLLKKKSIVLHIMNSKLKRGLSLLCSSGMYSPVNYNNYSILFLYSKTFSKVDPLSWYLNI